MRASFMVIVTVLAVLAAGAIAQPTERSPEPRSPAVEWVTREVEAPRVSFHTFDSAAAKGKVSYHLYTPAAYGGAAGKGFPVVYWLHGSGGGAAGIAKVAAHFDAAIEASKTPPCLVVFVNGLVEGMYVDWKDGTAPLETVIVKDLVPHMDGAYRTIATREGRMLDGFSMGGYGSARLGFKYPEMFRAVSIVGAGPMQAELIQAPRAGRKRAAEVLAKVYGGDQAYFRAVSPRVLAEQNAPAITKGSLVRMVIGDKDETFAANKEIHEHLERLKIPHTWTVLPGVAHDPMGVLTAMGDDNWAFYRAAFETLAPSASGRGQAFAQDDVRVSPPGLPMVDPEFNDVQNRVAYWDYAGARLNISVAEIDPRTGLLKSPAGRDFLVAEDVSPSFKEGRWWSHNGPEWGRDRSGWAIYFTKEDAQGNRQMWRAVEEDGRCVTSQLTTKPGGHCGALISQGATAADTRMLFYTNLDMPGQDTVAWAWASKPNEFHPLPDWRGSHSIARIVGEHHIGYAPRDKSGVPQVVLLDTHTGQRQVVTDEPGDKFDTYGFRAPEFGGELLVMANIDRQRLAIYRDVRKDGRPWQKIAELRLPRDSPFSYIYSCEPISPETGVNGTSYFSLNATRTPGSNRGETGRAARDGSIWVFGLGKDAANRFVQRVDEGAVSGIETTRYEPESYVGADEVFIYYERKDPSTGRGELRRCRTGIRVQREPFAKNADLELMPPPDGEAAKAAGLNRDVLTRLDLAMQQATASKEVAGVVGLVVRNGQRGYFEAFGLQDIEASTSMTKDAIFRLQSMSKPVVTVAALTLLDEGKFTLDEPISKHLPEWAEPKVLENGKLVPARHAITPRMLMSHSSGLYYGNLPGAAAGGGVTRDARTTLESYSKDLAARPLKFHPGEGYSYGTSIDVLGRYVEAVAGKPLDEVLKERVLFPLKMSDTDFWVPQEKASRIAQLYRQVQPGELARGREASQLTTKPSLFMGGQGLCSTAEDYERFCRMILNRGELDGVRVLKPETVDLMFENHIKAGGQRYGLGGAVDERGGYAWGGANGTQFWVDRTNKMFAVFMVQTQRYRAPTYNTFRRLVNEAAGVSGRGFDGPMGDQPGGEAPAAPAPGGGRLRQVFDRLDADSDGSLSKDEYAKSPMADRVEFATADADGHGSVSYQEAMAALRRR